jgi:hypothetical protein
MKCFRHVDMDFLLLVCGTRAQNVSAHFSYTLYLLDIYNFISTQFFLGCFPAQIHSKITPSGPQVKIIIHRRNAHSHKNTPDCVVWFRRIEFLPNTPLSVQKYLPGLCSMTVIKGPGRRMLSQTEDESSRCADSITFVYTQATLNP